MFNLLDTYGLLSFTSRDHKYAVTVFIQSLAPLNSVANPLIYVVFSTVLLHNIRYTRSGVAGQELQVSGHPPSHDQIDL